MDVKTRLKNAASRVVASLMPPTASEDADILDTLKKEHDEVRLLLADLVDAANARDRKALVRQIRQALVPHTKAEERIVYDLVTAVRDPRNRLDGAEAYLEHALAGGTLAKLGKLRPDTVAFAAAAKMLKDLVEHHIQEEERTIWPDVKDRFDSGARVEMNRHFLAAKKRIKV